MLEMCTPLSALLSLMLLQQQKRNSFVSFVIFVSLCFSQFFFLSLNCFCFFSLFSFVILFQSIFHSFTTIVVAQASKMVYVSWLKHHTRTTAHSLSSILSQLAALAALDGCLWLKYSNRIALHCISFCYSTIFKEYNFLFCAMFSRNGFCLERKCAFHYRDRFTKQLTHSGFYSRDCNNDKIECDVFCLFFFASCFSVSRSISVYILFSDNQDHGRQLLNATMPSPGILI